MISLIKFRELDSKHQKRIKRYLITFLTHAKTFDDSKTRWKANVTKALTLETNSRELNLFKKKHKTDLIIHLTFFYGADDETVGRGECPELRVCFNFHTLYPKHKIAHKPIYFAKLPRIAELIMGVRFRETFEVYKKITGQ